MGNKKSWGVRNVLILNLQTSNGARVGFPNVMPPALAAASGRQRMFAGRHPALVAGVKIGRAALWGFFLPKKTRRTRVGKKLAESAKKVLTNRIPPAIITIVDTAPRQQGR